MDTTTNEIEKAASDFSQKRNKPTLLLDLKQIRGHTTLAVEECLSNNTFDELDVILQTPGGSADAAFSLIKLIRTHAKVVNIFVPLFAKSAGTLLCLGADKIYLSDLSELGPLDTQIAEAQDGDNRTYKSALNGFKALEQIQQHAILNLDLSAKLIINRWGLKMYEALQLAIDFSSKTISPLYEQLNPKTIGEYARVLEVGEKYGNRILTKFQHWEENAAEVTVRQLVYNYPSHDYVLDLAELEELGLPVFKASSELDDILKAIRILLLTTSSEADIIKLIPVTSVPQADTSDPVVK